jgi:hypothetical protein
MKEAFLQEMDNGDSLLSLPEEILDTLGWEDGTELEISIVGNSIRISRAEL